MAGQIEAKASAVKFPVSGADSTGLTGIPKYTSSTTAASATIPTAMRGRFVRVASHGCVTEVSASVGAVTLVYGQTSALGTGSAVAGARIADGGYIEGILPNNCTHLNWVSSSGSGLVEIYCSELPNHTKATTT
jgi:hypothetical protein